MNKIDLKIFFVFLLLNLFTVSNNSAQTLSTIGQRLNAYQQGSFKEKVFVHSDREFYQTGELIWFKVYCLDATTNKTAELSKVVYVDVLDKTNSFVLQAKIALNNGIGAGSFYIPSTVASGAYKLRAYTNWMKNFGPDVFFEKQLTIFNLADVPTVERTAKNEYDIHFFPEGGELVNGLSTKVAFKALDKDGKGIEVKGVVVNQKNDTVARLNTFKLGMGSFVFKPEANFTYRAIVNSVQKVIVIKELPKAKAQGYSMGLSVLNDQVKVLVNTNLNTPSLTLIAHNNKLNSFVVQAEVKEGKFEFLIPKSKIADGVVSFTLFDQTGVAVCERLYFKRPSKQLLIEAQSDQHQYTKRKKVDIDLWAKDELGKQEAGHFSMAVYRLDSLNKQPKGNIVNYLWLSSALKGNIEAPDYYFTADNNETNQALDNLMLTQGWRHFNWKEALAEQKPVLRFLPEFNGHLINGKISNAQGGTQRDNFIYPSVPGKRLQFYTTKNDPEGNFLINTKDFYGTNELVLQTEYQIDSTIQLKVLSPFSEQFNKQVYTDWPIATKAIAALKANSLGVEVQETFVANKLKQFYSPSVDSTSFYGLPFKTYKLNDYTRFPTMEEVLKEYVAEVSVLKRQKKFHIKMVNEYGFLDEDPLVLVDGVPYFDMDQVFAIDPLKIERLEVIKDRFFYGKSIFEGILNFSTLKTDLAGQAIDPKAVVIDYEGLDLQREFYAPSYTTETELKNRTPDFRNLLHWAPEIKLEEQTKTQVSFFTSDRAGNYIVVIEGISENGIPGSKYFTFQVVK